MKKLIFITFYLILFSACRQNEITIPDTGRKISLNGLITTDKPLDIRIGISAFITDNNWSDWVSPANAKVSVYQNDQYIDTLYSFPNDPSNSGLFSLGNFRLKGLLPVQGKEYRIVVTAPGFPDASARVTIPKEVNIKLVDTTRIYYPNSGITLDMMCYLEFTDPPDEANYYMLMLDRNPPMLGNYGEIYFDCQDPIVEEHLTGYNYGVGIVFSDKMINGKKHLLPIKLNCWYFGYPFVDDRDWRFEGHWQYGIFKKTMYFKLFSIDEGFYRYIHSMQLYDKNFGNPLKDPVQVYSNVNGGLGILGGAAVSVDSLVYDYSKK